VKRNPHDGPLGGTIPAGKEVNYILIHAGDLTVKPPLKMPGIKCTVPLEIK